MQAPLSPATSSNMAVSLHVPFNISAPPNTDIWKLPPKHDVYNGKTSLIPSPLSFANAAQPPSTSSPRSL